MHALTGERIMTVLKPKLDLARIFIRRKFRAFMDFVLIIGLAVCFLFYGEVAHAEAVYSFTKTMGGTDHDFGQSVAVDSSGNVYITGSFQQTVDFNFTPGGPADPHTAVLDDIFLTKINADGSYGYTITMGGTGNDLGQSVAVDGSGNVYITGSFQQTVDFNFTPGGPADPHTAVLDDIFLTKINADGSYGYTITMGGTDHDYGQSVAVDGSDNVYVTGYFSGTDADFNPGGTADIHTSAGLEDIFLTKINSDGSYGYTKTMGGTDHDYSRSVTVDSSDNIYITGSFQGTADFDPGAGTDTYTSIGLDDIFLTKINFDGSYDLTKTMGGTDQDFGQSIAVDDRVNVYITGSFRGTVDFNPGAGTDNHTAHEEDIFLTKFRMVDFVVIPTNVTTTGAGGTATFTVRLLSEPSANVTLPVSSSNTTIGTVDPSNLTFTDINWSVNQTVTVTNLTNDGQTYSILLGAAISADADYNGLNPADVTVTIVGNNSGGGGGCFIATAAYGSPLTSRIKILCRFRDHFLLTNGIGKCFVRFYNTYSLPMADFIKKHNSLRVIVRLGLISLVGVSWLVLKIGLVFTMVYILFLGIGLIGFVKFSWHRFSERR
jgi:hypothetical protein